MTPFQKRILELGFTHREFARQLGQSRSTVSAWINGARKIPKLHVRNFALLLDIPVREVWDWNKSFGEKVTRREHMELARKSAHRRYAKVTRKDIDDAVSKYLAAGGTIKKLDDGPDKTSIEKLIEDIGSLSR